MSEQPAPAKQSASVVIVRDGPQALEVLLLRRNRKIAFHGGAWVFPGGRVDPQDAHAPTDAELDVARRAAAREALEEAGLAIAPQAMVPFAHWTTPVQLPKRFATWFFAATIGDDVPVRIDNREIMEYRWVAPRTALDLHAGGDIELPGPTWVTLRGLTAHADCAALDTHLRAGGVAQFVPRLVDIEGGRCTLYAEDAGYASLDLDAPGARHRLLMQGTKFEYLREF